MADKKYNPLARKEGTRPKKGNRVVRFDPEQIHQHFKETSDDIQKQCALADQLEKEGRCQERDNVWRAQLVFLAAAFDFFMHEITKYGMIQMIDGHWTKTDGYRCFMVDMETVELAQQADDTDHSWFLDYSNEYFGSNTMIKYHAVKKQFALLGLDVKRIAGRAFSARRGNKKTDSTQILQQRLDALFLRRNAIAHQVDRRHTDAATDTIDGKTVQDFLSDTSCIVACVVQAVKDMDAAESMNKTPKL